MNRQSLVKNLEDLNISPDRYSLYGELKPDSIILFENYAKWEVFYFDEKGNRSNEKSFESEEDACLYIYKMFKDAREIEKKFGINSFK